MWGFAVDKLAQELVFPRVLRFSPASIISPLLHIHLSPPHEVCDFSDQAATYHHLGPKLGASFLTRYFGSKQNKKVKKITSHRWSTVLSAWFDKNNFFFSIRYFVTYTLILAVQFPS
jgi:hypothetical protein